MTGILGLEPRILALARRNHCGIRLTAVEGSAEAIPLGDASVDAVVSTWTLCSIPEVAHDAISYLVRVKTSITLPKESIGRLDRVDKNSPCESALSRPPRCEN